MRCPRREPLVCGASMWPLSANAVIYTPPMPLPGYWPMYGQEGMADAQSRDPRYPPWPIGAYPPGAMPYYGAGGFGMIPPHMAQSMAGGAYGRPYWPNGAAAPPGLDNADLSGELDEPELTIDPAEVKAKAAFMACADKVQTALQDVKRKNIVTDLNFADVRTAQNHHTLVSLGNAASSAAMMICQSYENNASESPGMFRQFKEALRTAISERDLANLEEVAALSGAGGEGLAPLRAWLLRHSHAGVGAAAGAQAAQSSRRDEDFDVEQVSGLGGASVNAESLLEEISEQNENFQNKKYSKSDNMETSFEELIQPVEDARSYAGQLEQVARMIVNLSDKKRTALGVDDNLVNLANVVLGAAPGMGGLFGNLGAAGGGSSGGGFFSAFGGGSSSRRTTTSKSDPKDKLVAACLKLVNDGLFKDLQSNAVKKTQNIQKFEEKEVGKAVLSVAAARAVRRAMKAVGNVADYKDANAVMVELLDARMPQKLAHLIDPDLGKTKSGGVRPIV